MIAHIQKKRIKSKARTTKKHFFFPEPLLTKCQSDKLCLMIQILHHQGKRKFLYKMRCSLIFHIWRMRILLWCLSQTDAEGNGILPSRRDIKLRTLRVSAQVLSQESDSQEWGTVGNSGWHAYPLLSAICDSSLFLLCWPLSLAAINKVCLKQPSFPSGPVCCS